MIFIKNYKNFIIWIVFILIGVGLYFKPTPMSNLINYSNTDFIDIINTAFVFDESISAITQEVQDFNNDNITQDQLSSIINLLDGYYYARDINTIFSSHSLDNLGDNLMGVYACDINNNLTSLSISSNNQISINGKTHSIKNSSQLILDILSVLN